MSFILSFFRYFLNILMVNLIKNLSQGDVNRNIISIFSIQYWTSYSNIYYFMYFGK